MARRGAEIIGLGGYQPPDTLTSARLAERFGKSEQWIRERTGIEQRRVAGPGETVQDMALAAAEDALKNSGTPAAEIDLVIVASCSISDPLRATAAQVAELLGASTAAAFELNAACAGFCYALAVAADTVRAGSADKVLVIGAEKMTAWVDPADLGTSIIFGDGAGAAVVAETPDPGIGPVVWGSDGAQAELIHAPAETGAMVMNGPAVFRWATGEVHAVAERACQQAGIEPSELAAIVPHQANLRIVDALVAKLRVPDAAVARDITDSGNTSAASIPLALRSMLRDREPRPRGLALLVGFGAGLTYAAQVIRLPESPA
ncbi:3-oxoacyl-[acyl-carrier-protein] synthase-3 [Tamaricihabitans halophyticus]|uniref:3-oxoacyl-[acyl-carrier-protein] synthase-3 n=1 Tax=Tamaricihabitans halophyticus TaxID=1262583 RepID=A0A4R2QSK7_9PSEU|nr:beta-ketoacyl-ACP synthase III [Tamaricihabitans halophyticus]TCP51949.1 3-oxoacyl-[acyl-carrier-protein] synthase-3 [Tamaricihabitans halophyticus]